MSQQPPSYPSSTPPPGGYGPPQSGNGPPPGGYGPPQSGYGPPPGGYGPPHGGYDAPTTSHTTPQGSSPPPPPPLGGRGPAGPNTGPNTGTNTMAVLSVVFAFLFSPLGIVFGIIGRGQTRRTGQPGRGLATTGLVLSIVFLLAGVAAALYVTVLATQLAPWGVTSAPDVPGVSAPAVPDSPDQDAPDPAAPDPTAPVATGPVGTATVGVTNGDYGPEVPSDALAREVGVQTGATDVICPGYLPAQVDASTTCAGGLGGQQAQLQTRVTAVQGSTATVDIARVG
jgi:hypothetical protein